MSRRERREIFFKPLRALRSLRDSKPKRRKPTIFKILANIAQNKNATLKQLFQILPENNKECARPVLSLRLGERHCCFAIDDHLSKELIQLVYYTTEEVNENFLVELFAAHPELNKVFYKVLVCYDHPQSSLVPVKYYKQEEAGMLLESLYGVNSVATITSEPVTDWPLYNVYAVPKEMDARLSKQFSSATFCHQYSLNIRNSKAANSGGHLLVDFRKEDFTVLVTGNHQLLLEQTFLYSTPGDVIYYVLRICVLFGLSPMEIQLELSGLIDKQSALVDALLQYIMHVEFRDSAWSNSHLEYPPHFFTSLNDLSRCAS